MAIQTKSIQQNIKAVGNIKKMTKTMEMVSVSKMKRSTSRAKASRDYLCGLLSLLARIASRSSFYHPFFAEKTEGKELLILIASDKGLCGAYNTHLENKLKIYMEERSAEGMDVEVAAYGKQAKKMSERNGCEVVYYEENLPDILENAKEFADRFVNNLMSWYSGNGEDIGYAKIDILTTEFISTFETHARLMPLFPLRIDLVAHLAHVSVKRDKQETMYPYTFEPNEEVIVDELIPQILGEVFAYLFIDAKASEHSSRMIAMQNATESANNLEGKLVNVYNRARQNAITQEISEIVNTAGAV